MSISRVNELACKPCNLTVLMPMLPNQECVSFQNFFDLNKSFLSANLHLMDKYNQKKGYR